MGRWVSSNSWDCGYAISPQDPDVHVAHSPASLIGKVRHCLCLFLRGGRLFFSIWKVPISKVRGLSPLYPYDSFSPECNRACSCLVCLHCCHCIWGQKDETLTKYWTFRSCGICCTNHRETLTKSLLLAFIFCLFLLFFFFLSQLYFSQCEIQTDLHPGCTPSETDEMVFGCW